MKLLKQNYHGLPGIGISGKNGQSGENGKTVYFGFINKFFDGEEIEVDTYVYAAKRALQGIKKGDVSDVSILSQLINREIKMYDNSQFTNYIDAVNGSGDIDKMPYMDISVLYYTGNRLTSLDMVPDKMKVPGSGIDENFIANANALKLDINGEFLQMSFMVASALNSDNVSNGFVSYAVEKDNTPNIDLATSLDVDKNIIYKNVENNITHYTLNPSAALNIDINKNYETDTGLRQVNTITFDTIDAIYNTSISAAEAYAKGNILNNSQYAKYYYSEDSTTTYITEDISVNNSNILYVLDGKSYNASFDLNSSVYTIGLYQDKYFTESDESFWNEIFKTSVAINSNNTKYGLYYEEGDMQDENKNSFYGVPPRSLFTINSSVVNINRTGDASQFLERFPEYYGDTANHYKEWVSAIVTLNNEPGMYVYYTLDENDKSIFIPMSLKKDINVGDVIYFYTNEDDFKNYYNVNYMVVITEDLLNCTPKDLITHATLANPLNVKFFNSISKNRLCSFYDNAVLLNHYNEESISQSRNLNYLSNKSYISIINKYSTSAALLSAKNDFLTSIAYQNSSVNKIVNKIKDNKFVIQTDNTVKMKNLCVNQNKLTQLTNVELSKLVYNSNIILYDNYFVKPLIDIDLYHDNSNEYASIFIKTINGNEYFKNIENLDNYFYGCDIYDKNMQKINTIISNTETLNVEIIPTLDNTIYYIQMFASCGVGLKYYSKLTKLSVTYEKFEYINDIKKMKMVTSQKITIGKQSKKKKVIYDSPIEKYSKDMQEVEIKYQLKSFSLEIIGDDQNIIKQKYDGNIIFDISDINSEEVNDASLEIYSNNEDIEILDVMFNNLINSSTQINVNDWSYIQKVQNSSFKYIIDMSTNLPTFDSDVEKEKSISEYIKTGSNNDDEMNESPLFKKLSNDKRPEPTKQRSILVTAKYKFKDNDEIYYENFNLTQPGFNDTRDIPYINLDIHSNIIDLEAFNKLENNVLSNQFITYLDIDIKNFKECWGKFTDASTNILMDIKICNLQYDFDWQNKYVIKDLYGRKTFRSIIENNDASLLNNYIKTFIDINESTLDSQDSTIDISVNSRIQSYNLEYKPVFVNDCNCESNNDNNKYILFNSSIADAFNLMTKDSNIIYNGLQNNVEIKLESISVKNDSDKIRLKLLTEFGNPIISNIYYRFYVKSINIKVIDDHNNVICNFYTNVPDSIDEKASQTYLCKIDTEDSTNVINAIYKYISEPLDATFNPISYTICPKNIENSYTNIYGDDIYKYGIHEQIIKSLNFFNSSVYTSDDYIKDKITIRNGILYDYSNLNIKKSYVQDNIKNIVVKPISLYDIVNNIDVSSNKSLKIDSSIIDNHYILDFIEGNKYLSVVYHSTLLQPKIRNNKYTFYYNDREYDRTKYDQKINNFPIFAYDEQSIELRDDKLINSMDKWNDWYAENKETQKNNNTYNGVLSLYGNGYTQISDASIEFKNYYSLNDVIDMNNDIITTYIQTSEVDIDPMKQDQPNKNEYLRGFLYDINWEFPYYDSHNIIPYRIVSPFDNLLNNIADNDGSLNEDCSIYQSYYDELIEKNKSDKLYSNHMIPYTLLYDIQPRIAYNYDNNKINVFMLRRPSIGIDTDIIDGSTFEEKYEFNRRLFNLDNFKKLKSPYEIK